MIHIPPAGKKFFNAYREALLSDNERKIRAFCNRYGINPPIEKAQFQAAVDRAVERLSNSSNSEDAKNKEKRP